MQSDPQILVPIHLAHAPSFMLGGVKIHPPTRQLVNGGGRGETLEPRIMQVLVALAQAKGEILSRDDLIALCWDGRMVGDNAIHRAVSKVREVGLASKSFEIETITKVGYRLIVEGEVPPQPVYLIDEPVPPVPQDPSISLQSRRWMLGAGLGAAAVGASGLWLRGRDQSSNRQVAALLAQSANAMRAGLPDSEAQGVGFLEEAARIEPGTSLIWGKLALARYAVSEYAGSERRAQAVAATQDAAYRALALDKRQPDALAALALLPPYYGDWYAAEQRMRSVLAVDPQHLPTRDALDFMYVGVGRAREGALDRIAIVAKDPLNATYQHKLVYSLWILGRVGEADRAVDRALELWPKHPGIWFARLWTLAFTGRAERALAHIDDASARPDLPPPMIEPLRQAMIAIAGGRPADRSRATESVLRLVSAGPSMSINGVLILCGLGEIDRAFDVANGYLLERGPLLARLRWNPGDLSVNDQRRRKTSMLFVPVSAPMRQDPRFLDLTRDMGLADYWASAGVEPDFMRLRDADASTQVKQGLS